MNFGKIKAISHKIKTKEGWLMLWSIIGLLLLFWVLGMVFHVAGGVIHLLLIIAAVVLVIKLVSGRGRNRV
jgi:hypothetical protein